MDTLTILEKLKKKRPDLKEDPLMMELEAGLAEPMEGEMMASRPASPMDKPEARSYLDEPEAEMAEGEDMEADALMMEMDAEEGMETEADALTADAGSYLDEEEDVSEEMPAPKRKLKRPMKSSMQRQV